MDYLKKIFQEIKISNIFFIILEKEDDSNSSVNKGIKKLIKKKR
jgi:hypothetical protein